MKFLVLSLLVCTLASTGFSRPVENENQLPPIGGPVNVLHPIFLELAKETLLKVQDNLKAANRVEEALHLKKFIEKTDQFAKKLKEGEVQSTEAFDLDDHLDAIYNVLEKYKKYLPVDPTDEKLNSLSKNSEENKQLPPIGGPANVVNPIVLDLAKETLLKVQDNLRSAGRIEEALHLNKFIEGTDKMVEKMKNGDVQSSEVFEFEDHLDAIHKVLEKYKKYLPVDPNVALVVPTNEEIHEYLREEIDDLIEKLKEKKEYAKVAVLLIYKKILKDFEWKKKYLHMKKEKYEAFLTQIIEYIRRIAEGLRDALIPTTAASVVDTKISLLSSNYNDKSADFIRELLHSLAKDLEKIENNLMKSHHYIEAAKIKLHKAIVLSVASNTHGGNYDRKTVQYALNKGMEYLNKNKKYLNESKLWAESELDLENENEEKIDENDLPDQNQKEDN